MKYFTTAVSILLLAAVAWIVFFSGIVLKKHSKPNMEKKEQRSNAPAGTIIMETSLGNIEIMLDSASAPLTSANFEKLVRDGFYNNLTFHRVIPGFVIQGGDPKGDGTGGPGYTIPAEIKLLHKRGALATARLGDQANPSRASSGSQFYIALADLPMLDGQYTVFGHVTGGMDVVDKIAAVETDLSDKPTNPVIINKAYIK